MGPVMRPRSDSSGHLLRKNPLYKKKINLSTSLAGQAVGIQEVDYGVWLVSLMDYDLGYIDLEEKTLQPFNLRPKGLRGTLIDSRKHMS
jgi:hypothetical protein